MKDSELENCDDKKKELNNDAQVVDDLDYYVGIGSKRNRAFMKR
jgi:hypothetical protein